MKEIQLCRLCLGKIINTSSKVEENAKQALKIFAEQAKKLTGKPTRKMMQEKIARRRDLWMLS